jgi:hypothetical protein
VLCRVCFKQLRIPTPQVQENGAPSVGQDPSMTPAQP